MTGEDLPHDIAAEQKVLSAMLGAVYTGSGDSITADHAPGAGAIDAAAEILTPEDFYRPGHQVAYRAMVLMRQLGEVVAVETVRDWIAREGDLAALGGPKAGEYLFDLWHLSVPAFQVGAFAEIVRDRAARRRWILAADRIGQFAREMPGIDDMHAAAVAEADTAAVHAGEATARSTRLQGAAAFIASAGEKPVPVIDGVINRMDRIVVVGRGGSGKTILALQHGAAASVGIHPFGKERFDPCRVLWIDLEMPPYLSKEALELVLTPARYYGNPDEGGRFQTVHRPRGIDLGDRGQAQLLAGLIRKARPDLVIAGPVYKMHADRGERSDHTSVMNFWDDMRDRYGFGLWLETHPAKEGRFGGNAKKPTPAGASRWGDWCEIGFGMVPGKAEHQWDVVHFRGMRDRTRPWPEELMVNVAGGGWPWTANYQQGTFGGLT